MTRGKKRHLMNSRKRLAKGKVMSSSKRQRSCCRQEEWQQHNGTAACRFQQLPEPIVMDILTRVASIKTIFNCSCVCKQWLAIISDPQYAGAHLRRSPVGILMRIQHYNRISKKVDFIHVEESSYPGSDIRLEKLRFTEKRGMPTKGMSGFRLINACNGLLCLSGKYRNHPVFVCNPILGEYISIPPPSKSRKPCLIVGFGFSAATNEYKVLQIVNFVKAEVYTIGTGVWRSVGSAPEKTYGMTQYFNTLLHGAVHWVSYSSTSPDFIRSFNFETEQFQTLPLPSTISKPENRIRKLVVIRGCLHLCVYGADDITLDLWVMKDYGVQESWTKVLVLENLYEPRYDEICDVYQPIMRFSNGEVLLVYNDGPLVCYNPDKKTFREVIRKAWLYLDTAAYTPSFVSLYEVAEGEEVKRVHQRRKK